MKSKWLHQLRKRGKYLFDIAAGEEIKSNFLQAVPFWIASILTGLIAVGYSKLFTYAEDLLQLVMQQQRWYIFIVSPLCLIIAWLLIKIAPFGRGSGIPQVMAAIDISASRHESKINLLLNAKIIVIKIVSSMFMVLGGGAIGKEGPIIQISGSVFRLVNKVIPKSWPKLSNKSFILTGAAAGLAAAFNTPLGGIVFAIEELAKIHISFLRSALFTAVIIAGLTAQGLLGPYLYLGYPDVRNLPVFIYASVVIVAIFAGIAGGLMGKMTYKIIQWKKNFSTWKVILFIVCVGLGIATSAYFLNEHIIGSGKDLMNQLLFTDNKSATWDTVLARILGIVFSFNVGAAGGVFAPSLAAGAAVGAFISGLFHFVGANANILILSGMVGFLTGVTRTPFTSAILVLEMTDRHSVIFHLMLASMVSNVAALIVDKHSFYEHLKEDYIEQVTTEDYKQKNEEEELVMLE